MSVEQPYEQPRWVSRRSTIARAGHSTYWDSWYGGLARSATRDVIVSRLLDLPDEFPSNNVLPGSAARDLVAALALLPGRLLIDLACGRAGWGLELAARTGAELVGVDWSPVALGLARRRAESLAMTVRARFRLGSLSDSGLDSSSADAAICLDSVQFASPPAAAIAECFRVLRPSGRLVLTCWEAVDRSDPALSPKLRARDFERDLLAAGFDDVEVIEKPDWYAVEGLPGSTLRKRRNHLTAVWPLSKKKPAWCLPNFDAMRRVLATATNLPPCREVSRGTPHGLPRGRTVTRAATKTRQEPSVRYETTIAMGGTSCAMDGNSGAWRGGPCCSASAV